MTLLRGVDLSNHQGHPSGYRGTDWYQAAEFIIVQSINPPHGYAGWEVGGYTADQLRAAKEDGKYAGVYVWLWNALGDTRADIRARLALIPDDLQLDMRLWLDVEDISANAGPSRQQDVLDALEVMDEWAYAHGLPQTGIYSGDWYLSGYMDRWFPEGRMYWLADYSHEPEVFPSRPVHQYSSNPVDLNVMLSSEIISQAEPIPDEPAAGVDQGWQDKKDRVVQLAGELVSVATQIEAEAKRKGGPRRSAIVPLSDAVLNRALEILN